MFNKDINKTIMYLKEQYKDSTDISFRKLKFRKNEILLVYNQSITNSNFINFFIVNPIVSYNKKSLKSDFSLVCDIISANNIKNINNEDDVFKYLGNGFSVLFIGDKGMAIESKEDLSRGVSEPLIEQTISGPKDAFCENYMTNIGLVRKRIKSNHLIVSETTVGKQTKTKVSVLYMDNIAEKEIVDNVINKINSIDIDGLFDSTYIKEIIEDNNSCFSTIEATERPDLTSMFLLEGKVCVIMENSPYALIIPTFFIDLFHTPEDYYQKPKNVSFTRIIRIMSFFIAIISPAFYIAITTFNHETIPITLIVNFASQSYGVPFPTIVEAIGMSLVFEILRESDIRMPNLSGSAISILGAIVLGDAAVTAGIVSPIMVIVIAVSSMCSLMFSHVSMVNAIRLWKLIFMLLAAFFGLFGVFLGILLLSIDLSSLKSFGKPFLYPIVPLNTNYLGDTFILKNIKKRNKRNPMLTNTNKIRSRL